MIKIHIHLKLWVIPIIITLDDFPQKRILRIALFSLKQEPKHQLVVELAN